jgi:uncharacterized DUF497 family protein
MLQTKRALGTYRGVEVTKIRPRTAVISLSGRLLTVVHIEVDGEYIRIISARRASASEEAFYDQ